MKNEVIIKYQIDEEGFFTFYHPREPMQMRKGCRYGGLTYLQLRLRGTTLKDDINLKEIEYAGYRFTLGYDEDFEMEVKEIAMVSYDLIYTKP